MQFELRTQVIEPQRKTFHHLIDRYGDRPASRYEEGTIDLQATANYHYRPLWGPDKEIYDPAYSVLRLTDAYSFVDPRQYYYAPYVTSRADMHEAFGSTLGYLEKRGLFARLPQEWAQLIEGVVLPLRHYEAAAQMIGAHAARFGWGTTITQAAAYSAFDRIGNAQILSRAGISFGGGSASPLDAAKSTWLDDEAFQPMRKHVELTLVEKDWGKGLVALDVTDQLVYALLYTHLDEAALMGGAGSYSLVAQHLSGWFTDQRKWVDALYKAWLADPETGATNAEHLSAIVSKALADAQAALAPIAAKADGLVNADCTAALAAAADQARAHFSSLGITITEA
ncbi:MAG TPA: phenol 2-monooxygenase [Acidimicrobiaceae bacterium]|nr:phenol 2-monooxygenase [Acidimicrobiaceae bacterium]